MEYNLNSEKSGKAIFQIGGANDGAQKIITLENRTLIIGSQVIIAINASGALDESFGNQGKVVITQSENQFIRSSAIINDDGSFTTSELIKSGNYYYIVKMKFNSNGSKDTNFGVNGELNISLGDHPNATPIMLNLKDDIYLIEDPYTYPTLSKMDSYGNLDPHFGTNGILSLADKFNTATGLTISTQNNGSLLISGYTPISSHYLTLLSLNADGSINSSFGNEGIVKLENENIFITTSKVQENGDIILAGITRNQDQKVVVLKLKENGIIDSSFGDNGVFTLNTQNYFTPQTITTQEDGKLLIGGNTSTQDWELTRITADGVLDTGFNTTGTTIIPVGNSWDFLSSIEVQDDGKILLGGSSYGSTGSTASYSNISLARLNSDGGIDTSFGQNTESLTSNLITSNRLFVIQLYMDSLYRLPEIEGLDFWQFQLDAGLISRADTVSYFLDSPEFQGVMGGSTRLYLAALNRSITANDIVNLQDTMLSGIDKVKKLANDLANSTYSQLSDIDFINKVYLTTLDRSALQEETNLWIQNFSQGMSRGDLLYQLTDSADYRAKTDADVTLALMYIGLLHRISEQEGYTFWQQALQQGAKESDVIDSFLSSPEYIGRFTSEITMTGILADQTLV